MENSKCLNLEKGSSSHGVIDKIFQKPGLIKYQKYQNYDCALISAYGQITGGESK